MDPLWKMASLQTVRLTITGRRLAPESAIEEWKSLEDGGVAFQNATIDRTGARGADCHWHCRVTMNRSLLMRTLEYGAPGTI
jgi:hypothetical protein